LKQRGDPARSGGRSQSLYLKEALGTSVIKFADRKVINEINAAGGGSTLVLEPVRANMVPIIKP
jgi:hypothetical protein